MTADDIREALKTPLAVASVEEGRGWRALCTQCDDSEREKDEREAQEEGEDEYLPDRCEIDYSSGDDSESSDNEIPPVNTPSESESQTTPPQPPYRTSLFINLKVYDAAKELQIPALELLARERLAHSLRSHWARILDLEILIQSVYLRTDKDDHLRSLMCRIVAAEYSRGRRKDFKVQMREVMAEDGEFATDVLDAVIRLGDEWADMG